MIVLPGERVVLRPFRLDEVDALHDAYRLPDFPFGGSKLPTRAQLRRRVEHSGTLWNGKLELGVEAEGRWSGTWTPGPRAEPSRRASLRSA